MVAKVFPPLTWISSAQYASASPQHDAFGLSGCIRSATLSVTDGGRWRDGDQVIMPRRRRTRCSRLLTFQKNEAGPGYSWPGSVTGLSSPFRLVTAKVSGRAASASLTAERAFGRHCERSEAIYAFFAARWIASRSLSSGAHSRDPLARNDGLVAGNRVAYGDVACETAA